MTRAGILLVCPILESPFPKTEDGLKEFGKSQGGDRVTLRFHPSHKLRDNLLHVMELMGKKIQQIVNDLHAVIARMLPFEQKYGLLSADFYTLYQSGQSDTGENLRDVTLWAGAYEMKLKLEEAARRMSQPEGLHRFLRLVGQ